MVLILTLFGTPSILGAGGPLTGRAAQGSRLALLAVLALARGRPVSRDKITALLWPESSTSRARRQLSDSLYILRAALGVDVVRSTGDELVLNRNVTSDVESFERLLDERNLEPAVALFTGPLLDGFHLAEAGPFEHWLDAERARLGQRQAAALEALALASEERGEAAAAAGWWRKLAAHDPYSGRIALRLMRSLDATGDRAGALGHARLHAKLLREEFDAAPDPEVVAFAERLRTGPDARSAPRPADSRPTPTPAAAHPSPDPSPAPPILPEETVRPVAVAPSRTKRVRAYAAAALALLLALGVGLYGTPRTPAAAPTTARSLAVMPFVNMSADPGNGYFSDGLSEQIIARLSQIRGLRVVARTSSFALRDALLDVRVIGDTLGVEAVLEGSVRREGDKLRVTAQLIDASTGYHLWSENYDRELQDIFAVQDEIARAIAEALELQLPRSANAQDRRMPDLAAYDLYLRALYLRNDLSANALRQATELLDRAIALEPMFALAHAAKASVVAPRIYFRHVPLDPGVSEMRVAVRRALELDSQLGEAHAALGILRLFFEWDWQGAERALRRAIELNPSDPHAYHMLANYLVAMRRFDEGVAARERAVALDPLNARTGILLGADYTAAHRFDDAMAQYERALGLDPVHPLALGLGPTLPAGPARVYLKQGRHAEAVEEYLRIAALRGATVRELEAMRNSFESDGMRGFWRRWLELDLRQSGNNPDPLRIAILWALIGDTDQALDWLERAHREHNPGLIYLLSDGAFSNLLAHPRLARILGDMKFPPS